MLKIVFAGTPEFAVPTLQAIIDSEHKIIAVYTQPDRPAGRGRHLKSSPVKQLADAHDIPIFQPESLREKAEQRIFAAINPDIVVVVAYGLILSKEILQIPRYGCINVHASLLPRWRGAAPIQRAILAGDKETGITIMQMDEGLDTGAMLNRVVCTIKKRENSLDLQNHLAKLGAEALLMTLSDIEAGRVKSQKQDDNLATYAKKITKEEAKINWQLSAEQISRAIRAFYPRPIAYTYWQEQQVRLLQSQVLSETTEKTPGTILRATKEGIDVATGKRVLRVLHLQLPGGKPLSVEAVLASKKEEFQVGHQFL